MEQLFKTFLNYVDSYLRFIYLEAYPGWEIIWYEEYPIEDDILRVTGKYCSTEHVLKLSFKYNPESVALSYGDESLVYITDTKLDAMQQIIATLHAKGIT